MPLATLAPLVRRRPRSTEALVGGGAAPPTNNKSTLETKAVLIIVVAADRKGTLVAKAGIEIFSLDGAQGKLFVYLDVKSPTYRHGEGVPRVRVAAGGVDASSRAGLTSDGQTVPAEVKLEKWPKRAGVSKGNPRSEQIRKLTPANFVARADCAAEILAPAQVSGNAEHAG